MICTLSFSVRNLQINQKPKLLAHLNQIESLFWHFMQNMSLWCHWTKNVHNPQTKTSCSWPSSRSTWRLPSHNQQFLLPDMSKSFLWPRSTNFSWANFSAPCCLACLSSPLHHSKWQAAFLAMLLSHSCPCLKKTSLLPVWPGLVSVTGQKAPWRPLCHCQLCGAFFVTELHLTQKKQVLLHQLDLGSLRCSFRQKLLFFFVCLLQ